jgi:hypothetical protein
MALNASRPALSLINASHTTLSTDFALNVRMVISPPTVPVALNAIPLVSHAVITLVIAV